MLRKLLGAACALAIAAAPAEAQWKYEFSGFFNDDAVPLRYDFTLLSVGPVVGPGQVAATPCTVTRLDSFFDVFYTCELPGPGMAQNGFGTGVSLVDAKWQKFDVGDPNNATGGGGAFFWFDPVAFFTPGTYQTYNGTISAPNPNFGDPNCDPNVENCGEFNFYGSAGEATLIVTNTTPTGTSLVPEPSTYLLVASGLFGLGAAARRRRIRAA